MAEVVTTGIPKLDTALMNGVPRGYTILVKGTAGSGKELFAKQFASAGAEIGENVVYFPTEETDEDLISTLKRFKWSYDMKIVNIGTQYYEKILMKDLQANIYKREGFTAKQISSFRGVSTERERIDFLSETVYATSRVRAPFRIVVDTLDFYLNHYPKEEVIAAIQTIKAHTQYQKSLSLLTISSDSFERTTESVIEGMADIIFDLEIAKMASTFENHLVIRKVRNYPEKAAILIYAITEHGITPEMVSRIA
jgi:KaiC/GvpD/RAD55 family RecA-like ATPase